MDEDPEDDDEDNWKLYIADRGNSRVVVWDELPKAPGSGKETEDPDRILYESEELMGDDDDFMDDDEDDDSPPGSVPVA